MSSSGQRDGGGGGSGGGVFSKFEGSLRSSCQLANGDVLMRNAQGISQKEAM